MFFTISYDYAHKINGRYVTYTGNLVGRDGRVPVGYGPVGPEAIFNVDEIAEVMRVLAEQLGTAPTLHLHPHN